MRQTVRLASRTTASRSSNDPAFRRGQDNATQDSPAGKNQDGTNKAGDADATKKGDNASRDRQTGSNAPSEKKSPCRLSKGRGFQVGKRSCSAREYDRREQRDFRTTQMPVTGTASVARTTRLVPRPATPSGPDAAETTPTRRTSRRLGPIAAATRARCATIDRTTNLATPSRPDAAATTPTRRTSRRLGPIAAAIRARQRDDRSNHKPGDSKQAGRSGDDANPKNEPGDSDRSRRRPEQVARRSIEPQTWRLQAGRTQRRRRQPEERTGDWDQSGRRPEQGGPR